MLSPHLVEELQAAVGEEFVLTARAHRLAYCHDSWPLTMIRMLGGADLSLPDLVVLPSSTGQVAACVRIASAHRIPLIPFGGGSGVCGGTTPPGGGIILDTKRMNRILELNEKSLLIRVQPGHIGLELETWLNRRGYTLGHFPQSIACSTAGGWVVTRASGQFSTKYGNIEDILLAVEAVLPGGEVVSTRHTGARSSTGPDLKQLFLGSEGTLGVITGLAFKINPLPAHRRLQSFLFPSFHQGLEAIRLFMREGARPAVARLYDPLETARNFPAHQKTPEDNMLLLLSEGSGRLVEAEGGLLEEVCAACGGVPAGSGPVTEWLHHRNVVKGLPEYLSKGFVVDTIEVAAIWDRVGDLYEKCLSALMGIPGILVASGHSSHSYPHGTNIYITFGGLPGQGKTAEQLYLESWRAVMEACLGVGGTICHHHGIGLVRMPWMRQELGSSYRLLQLIKQAVDPRNIMNPGKLLEVAR
ncbi:MAG: FAD-binding oxidoreductase [Bacillota bacterium]